MPESSSRPKLFNRATVKLTLIYTAILLAISICFSVAIGVAASQAAGRPFDRPPQIVTFSDGTNGTFAPVMQEHIREVNEEIFAALLLINLGVLILGAGLSFLLAHWTLKPIEQAMAEESRFVADASHELRTPLAVMITENEVTLRDKSADKNDFREQVSSNLAEAQKLQNLANYLLEMNNADATVEFAENDLTEIIDDAISRIESKATAKKIKIVREIQPVKLTTNAETLSEIVAIILDNAVKYSPAKSEVKIVANAIEIAVSDAGGGMNAEDLPHIFERFYRAEQSRTSEGFGLGLSLAQNLANKIHAKISAENIAKDDRTIGAKFTIKL